MKGIKAFKKINNKIFQTGGIGGSIITHWKIGDVKEVNGDIELCGNGFHFYISNNFVFGINLFGDKTCFCEVEALGNIKSDTEKCVTNKIKIIRLIPMSEWKKQLKNNYNSGNYNSGNRNSGYCNSGYCNSGNYNSGDGYINYFCEKTKYFLFDIEVDNIPTKIKNLNMSWFNLDNKTYKEAWLECPEEVLNTIKSIDVIMENKEKFFNITGIKL